MNDEFKKPLHQVLIEWLQKQIEGRDKIIDLMANDLATDYHSKEWIIEHYLSEVKNGSRRGN